MDDRDTKISGVFCPAPDPKKEMLGGAGEPCARLCPLGWTAMGRINTETTEADHSTSLCHTYHMQHFGEVPATEEQ